MISGESSFVDFGFSQLFVRPCGDSYKLFDEFSIQIAKYDE